MSESRSPLAHTALGRVALIALIAAPAPALFAGGCHEDVTLGTDAPFCQGKACGAPCALDPCAPATPDCGVPTAGICDGNVACTASVPACTLTLPCQGQKCGAPCTPMLPMAQPGLCDAKGTCKDGPPMCPPDPCHGLPCGSLCNPMCDPLATDGGCPPPPVPMACDMTGQCLDARMVGCKGMACLGMTCGKPCRLCDPMNPTCMETPMPKSCDPSGLCTPAMVTCP